MNKPSKVKIIDTPLSGNYITCIAAIIKRCMTAMYAAIINIHVYAVVCNVMVSICNKVEAQLKIKSYYLSSSIINQRKFTKCSD
jgi:hypothetical protein